MEGGLFLDVVIMGSSRKAASSLSPPVYGLEATQSRNVAYAALDECVLSEMFYDLNVVVDGVGEQSRREVVAMAMQLGYCGVAANHMCAGVMADSDRCKFRPLGLQTVLAAAPGVEKAARFHRGLLGVPLDLPFRQFSRITVVVDNQAQANALNAGNPVLKTYDIVAARPTNQKAFHQACTQLEVDLIALDISQKLPFRLKMASVKAAVQRGIYFEVPYGQSIFDPRARRELFANAQMLLAAARGRNIIVSSGARRALEIRGPNDAANMSTLFGLSLESAKAALSYNCNAVIMHGVMRKATYKGAIHIDHAITTIDPESLFNVPSDWDPLSIGGASADFIPMDETTERMLDMDHSPSEPASKTWANSQTISLGADANTSGISVSSSILEPISQNLVPSGKQHMTFLGQDKMEGSTVALKPLRASGTVAECIQPSVVAGKEKKLDGLGKIVEKRAHGDILMGVDSGPLKLDHKKSKHRKKRRKKRERSSD